MAAVGKGNKSAFDSAEWRVDKKTVRQRKLKHKRAQRTCDATLGEMLLAGVLNPDAKLNVVGQPIDSKGRYLKVKHERNGNGRTED